MKMVYHRLSLLLTLLPATALDLADPLEMEPDSISCWLRQLRAAGVISAGRTIHRRGRQYLLKPSTPYGREAAKTSQSVAWFGAVWHALAARRTTAQMAEALGVTTRTVNEILSALRAHGLARICAWRVSGAGSATPFYDRLPGSDAPRPAPEGRTAANQRYYARRLERRGGEVRV